MITNMAKKTNTQLYASQLEDIYKSTLELLSDIPFVQKEKGDNIITLLEPDVSHYIIIEKNKKEYIALRQTILNSLRAYSGFLEKYQLYERDLLSYICFERIGGNIEENLWRKLFVKEFSEKIYGIIDILKQVSFSEMDSPDRNNYSVSTPDLRENMCFKQLSALIESFIECFNVADINDDLKIQFNKCYRLYICINELKNMLQYSLSEHKYVISWSPEELTSSNNSSISSFSPSLSIDSKDNDLIDTIQELISSIIDKLSDIDFLLIISYIKKMTSNNE